MRESLGKLALVGMAMQCIALHRLATLLHPRSAAFMARAWSHEVVFGFLSGFKSQVGMSLLIVGVYPNSDFGEFKPVISEVEARVAHPDYFLVLPWHFIEEASSAKRTFVTDHVGADFKEEFLGQRTTPILNSIWE